MRTQSGTRWEVRRRRQIRSPHTNRYVRTGGFSGFGPLVGLLASLEESLMTGGWRGESFSVLYPPTTCEGNKTMLRMSSHQQINPFSSRLEVVSICTPLISQLLPLMLTKRWSCHVKTRFLHLRKSWKELTSAKHEAITLVVKKTYTRLLWYFSAESCLGPPTQDISTFPQRKRSFRRSGLKIWAFCPLYKTLFLAQPGKPCRGQKYGKTWQ